MGFQGPQAAGEGFCQACAGLGCQAWAGLLGQAWAGLGCQAWAGLLYQAWAGVGLGGVLRRVNLVNFELQVESIRK